MSSGGNRSKPVAVSASDVRLQLVAGQLLANEPVVWQIVVERSDHVVAIPIRILTQAVFLETFALAVPHDVEPMLCPPFAIRGEASKPIDNFRIGVRRSIRKKRRLLGDVGGKPVRSNVTRRAAPISLPGSLVESWRIPASGR